MIATLQNYQINNFNATVDLTKIPETTPNLREIATKLKIQLPTPPKTGKEDASIVPIQELEKLLQETKDHSTRDKAIAILKTALAVATIAGIVLACVFGGVPGLIGGPILGGLFLIISNYLIIVYTLHKIIDTERKSPNADSCPAVTPCFSMTVTAVENDYRLPGTGKKQIAKFIYPLIAAPVLPIYEAFTRESRIQRILDKQRDALDVDKKLARIHEENSQLIPIAYNYYKSEADNLFPLIEERIEQTRKELSALEQFSEKLPLGEIDLRNRIRKYETARDEFRRIQQFYLGLERTEPAQ